MQRSKVNDFGPIRSFVWPIYHHEHKKLIPMIALFFLISFIYNLLRCLKISLMVTAEGSGADAIPFLKVGAVLPGSFLFIWLFAKLASKFDRERVFYIIISIFLSFFALFLFVIYPNLSKFQFNSLADFLLDSAYIPEGFNKGLIPMVRYWILSVFYVMCELWSNIVLSMLFWGFANEVTKVHEAKRFYAIFALAANFSGIISGQIAQLLTVRVYNPRLIFGTDAWDQTVFLQISTALILGLVIMRIFWWLNREFFSDEDSHHGVDASIYLKKQARKKLSMKECFSYIAKSRYMLYIVIIVVAYNIVYNLTDVLFTAQVKARFVDKNQLNAYMNQVTTVTGIVAVFLALFVSGNVIRRFGWKITALITPIVWLATSLGFFSCLLMSDIAIMDVVSSFLGNPINLALLFGSAQMCLGRASKYTVFDETKEIAFIPLSKESQRKGKAVVDGLASRFGKSGGAVIYLILLWACGNLAATIPYVAVIVFLMIGLWFVAVRGLAKKVDHLVEKEIMLDETSIEESADKVSGSSPTTIVGSTSKPTVNLT